MTPKIRTNQVILQADDGRRWIRFSNPRRIVTTTELTDVTTQLQVIDQLVNRDGYYAAGFISYEAAPAFDEALVVRQQGHLPLLWFGIYDNFEQISLGPTYEAYDLGEWSPTVSKDQYGQAFSRIKELIALGRTYQVNYTLRLRAPFSGSAWSLFEDLVNAQESKYAAYVDIGSSVICSASPELFFKLDDSLIVSKPMKGTASRGRTTAEDKQLTSWLFQSEKNRAENVMIVDMIRNDFGRVSEVGSVTVPHLFDIERYPTLFQMTSTVNGLCNAPFHEIITALFPCASITGAPKISTMQIISDIESDSRGIYTGCIGYLAPGRQAQFNVAIRTVVADRLEEMAEYGVGGGIVWGSEIEGEYEEWKTKARILTDRRPVFQLLESILWTPDEAFFLLEEHLSRLNDSAEYFGFICNTQEIRHKLEGLVFPPEDGSQKVRLIVHRDGNIDIEIIPVGPNAPVRVILAEEAIDETDVFLYHKTTNRQLYEFALSKNPAFDDVLLWNKKGEITETSTANVVFKIDGELVTPPISSGLLGGTYRKRLLEDGNIREGIVTKEDLKDIEDFYLINSVRKWRRAILVLQPPSSSEL